MNAYYLTSDNNKWTNKPQTKEQILDNIRGCKVEFIKSRINSYELLIVDGKTVGKLFDNQSEQIAYLKSKNLI